MTQVIFLISLCAILALFLLCLPAFFSEKYRFFPPSRMGSWQYHLFWMLFRLFILGLIVISFLDYDSLVTSKSNFFGLPLLIGGIGSASYHSYVTLGKSNSYGGKSGLRKDGIYRWSRNPIYVVTWLGILGWGLFVNSVLVWVLLGLWAMMYLLAPYIEEPWLEKEYGGEYIQYKADVPRFIGFPKKN